MIVLATRRRWELPAAAAVVLALTVAFAWQSYFFADDLFFPAYFRENTPGLWILGRSWFGHLMPAYPASIVGFLAVFGLSWPAAAAIIGLIHTGAFVAVVRILDAVVGVRRLALLCGLAFTLSLGPVALRLWWAASLNNTLALALGLAALGCCTRFVTGRRWRSLAAGLLLYALALACSEKSLLFSMHILLWCVLVVWRGAPLLERGRRLLRAWPMWAGIAVLSAVDLILFLRGPYLLESGAAPSTSTTFEFMVKSVFGGLVPSFFGLDLLADSPPLLSAPVLVPAVLMAVFVVVSIVVVRSNAGVWLFALVAVTANTFALSRRADVVGVEAGRELRYHLENTALVWLAIGVVVFSLLQHLRERRAGAGAVPEPEHRRDARRAERRAPVLRVAAIVAACLLVSASTVAWTGSAVRIVESNHGRDARAWVETLDRTLPEDPPPLLDSPLPEHVGLPALWPWNMASAVLPVLGHDVTFTDTLDGAWIVGEDGTAGPATTRSVSVVSPRERCSADASDLAYPAARVAAGRSLLIHYTSEKAGTLAVYAGSRWTLLERPAGSGTLVVYLPAGTGGGELLISPQGVPLCVDGLGAADVVPAG